MTALEQAARKRERRARKAKALATELTKRERQEARAQHVFEQIVASGILR